MKNFVLFLIIAVAIYMVSCKKDSQSESFKLLTGPTWASDSLLANGTDAGGPGGLLANFKGDAKFKTDGTGTFGNYKGTWKFAMNDTEITITADSLLIPLTTKIAELTSSSLKITTSFPNPVFPLTSLYIRMTFKAK